MIHRERAPDAHPGAQRSAEPPEAHTGAPVGLVPCEGRGEDRPAAGEVRDGDQSLAQVTELAVIPIFPESETGFFYEDTDARITFRLDDAGAAIVLTLHQGGISLEMARIEH